MASSTVRFRTANIDDARAIAQVHVDTWRTTYAGIVPDAYIRDLSYERRERQWQEFYLKPEPRSHVLVALVEETIVGFSCWGEERGAGEQNGEVFAIYLLSKFHGQGIGKELFFRSFATMLEEGFSSVTVWALADNPTCVFYRNMGGSEFSEKFEAIGGVKLKELSFQWNKKDMEKLLSQNR
jgi:GNAT superfamily N-acetyltransferase